MEAGVSVLRVLENVPVLGHLLALLYICIGRRSCAERAAIKATLGILLFLVNIPAEIVDESTRKRSPKLFSDTLTPRPDWMKTYKRRNLRHLCLPATHQSATFIVDKTLRSLPMIEGWSKCQTHDIWTQLVGGIRFFDFRLMSNKESKEVWTHHTVVQCVRFRDILQTVRDFVKDYPTEIVSLYLTNDGKDLDWGQVRAFITEYIGASRIIPEYMSEMLIDDITNYGRNVIFYGVPDVAFSWSCLDYRWPNKSWPEDLKDDLARTLQDLAMYNPYYLFWYKAECATNSTMIIRDLGGLPGAVVAKQAPEKFAFMEDLAAAVNYQVTEVLKEVKRLPLNVFSTDYVTDYIIARIIEMNRNEETGAGPMPRSQNQSRSQSRLSSIASSQSTSLNRSVSLNRSFALATNLQQDELADSPRTLSRSLNYITEESVFLEDETDNALNTSLLQVWETTC